MSTFIEAFIDMLHLAPVLLVGYLLLSAEPFGGEGDDDDDDWDDG